MTPRNNKRGPWGQSEDRELLRLVKENGAHNWVQIANLIDTRSPKQCRERYHQNLKPTLSHEPITPEEGESIERLVNEMGKRWAEIARRLPGRSDNAVKNWWNGGMNRRRRIVIRRYPEQNVKQFDENVERLSITRPAPLPHHQRQILVPTSQRRIEQPLTSPANSERSMPDSLGEAPSLVSDSSSHVSMSSPGFGAPPHRPYLPFPDPLPSEPWRPLHTSQANIAQPTSDSSPPSWTHSGIPKSPYILAPPHQRLEQFAEVATRTAPVKNSNIEGQHQRFVDIPIRAHCTDSRRRQPFAELPTRPPPSMTHVAQRQHQHSAEYPARTPPAASFMTRGQHQQFPNFPARPPPVTSSVAQRQYASVQDPHSLPSLRTLFHPTNESATFPMPPTTPYAPVPARPAELQAADRSTHSASTVRSPDISSLAPPTENLQQPSSSRKRTADDADLAPPPSSSRKRTADGEDLTAPPSKTMDLSNVLD